VTLSSGEDGVVSLASGVRQSAVGGPVKVTALAGAVALSGGAASTGAAAGGVVSLVGGASEASVGGGVDLSSGAGVLGSGVVKFMSGASAVGDALSGSAKWAAACLWMLRWVW
jgi:hypothetical protein